MPLLSNLGLVQGNGSSPCDPASTLNQRSRSSFADLEFCVKVNVKLVLIEYKVKIEGYWPC